jgi:hypothetical protein
MASLKKNMLLSGLVVEASQPDGQGLAVQASGREEGVV